MSLPEASWNHRGLSARAARFSPVVLTTAWSSLVSPRPTDTYHRRDLLDLLGRGWLQRESSQACEVRPAPLLPMAHRRTWTPHTQSHPGASSSLTAGTSSTHTL